VPARKTSIKKCLDCDETFTNPRRKRCPECALTRQRKISASVHAQPDYRKEKNKRRRARRRLKPRWSSSRRANGTWNWSKKEDDFLRKHVGQETVVWIASQLNRPFAGVAARAFNVLKLKGLSNIEKKKRMVAALVAKSLAFIVSLKDKEVLLGGRRRESKKTYAAAWFTGKAIEVKQKHQYLNAPELRCAFGHFFPAPACRRNVIKCPWACPFCVAAVGGKKCWLSIRTLANVYGLSVDEYRNRRQQQEDKDGVVCCAVCKIKENGQRLATDHDHSCCPQSYGICGKCVRGLLCPICNHIVGAIESGRLPRGAAPNHDQYIDHWSK